jgi:hypothetical protein
MLVSTLVTVLRYARNIPIAEDWFMVPPLTGHEPNLLGWLWEQNNEHRIPFPKGLLLLLLKATGGDFRSGMVTSTLLMGAMAAGMIWAASRVRGRASLTDLFFPATMLHLGHRDNLGFNWQLTQVMPALLACALLVLIVVYGDRPTGRAAVAAGICLMLLPLSGMNGLVPVPALALWLLIVAVPLLRRRVPDAQTPRWAAWFLVGSVAVTLLLCGYYFHGFERYSYNPPNPGILPSLKMAGWLLALCFGPSAQLSWTVFVVAACALLLVTTALLASRWLAPHEAGDRNRRLGLLIFFAGMFVLTMGVAWGRAAWVPKVGIPMRYVIIPAPLLCWAYYIWLLYGPRRVRGQVLAGLAVLMVLLVPLNVKESHGFIDWYDREMTSLERDMQAGMPRSVLAERHQGLLLHWNLDLLKTNLALLRDSGMGPFRDLPEDTAQQKEAETRNKK